MTFPHTGDAVAGEFSDNRVDKIVWNIDGELVPGHVPLCSFFKRKSLSPFRESSSVSAYSQSQSSTRISSIIPSAPGRASKEQRHSQSHKGLRVRSRRVWKYRDP